MAQKESRGRSNSLLLISMMMTSVRRHVTAETIKVSDNDTSHFTGTTEVGKGMAEKMSLRTTARKLAGTAQMLRDPVVRPRHVGRGSSDDWESSVADSRQP